MKIKLLLISAVQSLLVTTIAYAQQSPILSLLSPDGLTELRLYQKTEPTGGRSFYYQVSYDRKAVILESRLELDMDNSLSEKAMGLKVDQHIRWFGNLKVKNIVKSAHDQTWTPVCGERAVIRDHYNAATVELEKDDNDIYPLNIQLRAYDEGVAFRFFFPENVKGTYYNITAEHTEFAFEPGAVAWFANWAQAPYLKLGLQNWPGESERPLTLKTAGGMYIALAEAQMVDYARTKFKLSENKSNTIETSMAGGAQLISPFATPWRVVMIGKKAGDLIEHDYLLLNLNEPNRLKDTSWIKPGKIMRVMTQNTAFTKRNIDFAEQQGLEYILFDWKWYGPAFSFDSDATKVAIRDFDLPGIVSYARSKNIGVWLYVNQQALLAQSDSLFRVYQSWGIKGVKFGFVQVGSHRWTTWLEKAIQQAADNRIMVNVHDDWRPTGEQRSWPNLMTAEGIRGNEEMPDATHNTVLPFTRYLAGPADYTICYFSDRIKTSHAHQLALAAIYYSPIQTLFWYDKPEQYHHEPELEFWRKIPTTWDETKILGGEPGEYVITARRKGDQWYIGAITNNKQARHISIPLSFLKKGMRYEATIYNDDKAVNTSTHVGIKKIRVDQSSEINEYLITSGGVAIMLSPRK